MLHFIAKKQPRSIQNFQKRQICNHEGIICENIRYLVSPPTSPASAKKNN